MPHSGGRGTGEGLLIMLTVVGAIKMIQLPSKYKWQTAIKISLRGPSAIGLFTTFVQTTKLLNPKSVLDLVHSILGLSHSWWALEIALFLSRWRWAGPSSLTSCSGAARLWGLCRVQQANGAGPGSLILPMLLWNPPLTLRAKKKHY